MRPLTSILVAMGLFGVIGCTQPVPVKTTKSGANSAPTVATTPVVPSTKPAEKAPEKPAEKPADKTPPSPPK